MLSHKPILPSYVVGTLLEMIVYDITLYYTTHMFTNTMHSTSSAECQKEIASAIIGSRTRRCVPDKYNDAFPP